MSLYLTDPQTSILFEVQVSLYSRRFALFKPSYSLILTSDALLLLRKNSFNHHQILRGRINFKNLSSFSICDSDILTL